MEKPSKYDFIFVAKLFCIKKEIKHQNFYNKVMI